MPFSLSVGPFIFTKIQKALTKHCRRQRIRLFTYLDDGAGVDSDFSEAQRVSDMVRADLWRSGFVANDVKSQWVPIQSGELLGYVLNLHAGTFEVPQRRVYAFHHVLRDVIAHKFVVSARTAARFTGLLASVSLALGPVACLWTRSLYRDILEAVSWDSPFQLSEDAQDEAVFWEKNFCNTGYPIWSPRPKPEVLTYADASDSGWGRFAVQVGGQVAVGSWSVNESNKSSTFRELRATGLVLKSFAPLLRGKEVLHRIDNKNTEIILSIDSRKSNLHNEARDGH